MKKPAVDKFLAKLIADGLVYAPVKKWGKTFVNPVENA